MDITYVVLRVSSESHRYIIWSLILIHAYRCTYAVLSYSLTLLGRTRECEWGFVYASLSWTVGAGYFVGCNCS